MEFPDVTAHNGPALFRRTSFTGKLLSWLKSLFGMQVSPGWAGSFSYSENNAILDLNPLIASLASNTTTYTTFEVVLRPNPEEDGYQYAVAFGYLFPTSTPDPATAMAITGVPDLSDWSSDPASALVWKSLTQATDIVYVDLTDIDIGGDTPIGGAKINSQSAGGSLDITQSAFASDDAFVSGTDDDDISTLKNMKEGCYPLAYISTPSGKPPVVIQSCFGNLMVFSGNINGMPVLYPRPL